MGTAIVIEGKFRVIGDGSRLPVLKTKPEGFTVGGDNPFNIFGIKPTPTISSEQIEQVERAYVDLTDPRASLNRYFELRVEPAGIQDLTSQGPAVKLGDVQPRVPRVTVKVAEPGRKISLVAVADFPERLEAGVLGIPRVDLDTVRQNLPRVAVRVAASEAGIAPALLGNVRLSNVLREQGNLSAVVKAEPVATGMSERAPRLGGVKKMRVQTGGEISQTAAVGLRFAMAKEARFDLKAAMTSAVVEEAAGGELPSVTVERRGVLPRKQVVLERPQIPMVVLPALKIGERLAGPNVGVDDSFEPRVALFPDVVSAGMPELTGADMPKISAVGMIRENVAFARAVSGSESIGVWAGSRRSLARYNNMTDEERQDWGKREADKRFFAGSLVAALGFAAFPPLMALGAVLVMDGMVWCTRSGGCLTPDSLVKYNSELIPIGRVGMVTGFVERQPVVAIATGELGWTRLTLDHLVRVLDRGEIVDRAAGKISLGDRLFVPVSDDTGGFERYGEYGALAPVTGLTREIYSGELFNIASACGYFATRNVVVSARCRG